VGQIKRNRHGPEWYIQQNLIKFLEARQWLVEHTHGNLYQQGMPDLFCNHLKWGYRWIDCKVKGRYSFTKAQKIKWPIWESFGVGIWILTDATQDEYDKLFRPPNWRDYWKTSWGVLPDIERLLSEITDDPD
jgi:hypothetical protein